MTKLRELSSLNWLGAEKLVSNDDGYCWAESCGHGNKRERLYRHTGSRVSELIGLEWQGVGEQQDKEERENTKRNKRNNNKKKHRI